MRTIIPLNEETEIVIDCLGEITLRRKASGASVSYAKAGTSEADVKAAIIKALGPSTFSR